MIEATDEELMERVRDGDAAMLGVLFERYQGALYSFFVRLTSRPSVSEDLVQEVFLRILKYRHTYRGTSPFRTWMYQIALNLCRDQVRRRARWRLRIVDAPPDPDRRGGQDADETAADQPLPDETLESRRRERAVHEALGDLPPPLREVVFLKEFEGLKFREIADVLGCPESTVKSRMYFALDTMRRSLERRGVVA